MSLLLGKSITSASFGKSLLLDIDKRFELDKDSNIIMLGRMGSGRTKAIKSLIKQLEYGLNTYVVLITSTASEYADTEYVNIESAEKLNDSYESRDRLNKLINLNSNKGLRTVVIVDDNFLFYKKELLKFVENLSIISKVHNCLVISTWTRLGYIPNRLLKATSIIQTFRVFAHDLENVDSYKNTRISKEVLKTSLELRRGQRVLNIDNNLILIESE